MKPCTCLFLKHCINTLPISLEYMEEIFCLLSTAKAAVPKSAELPFASITNWSSQATWHIRNNPYFWGDRCRKRVRESDIQSQLGVTGSQMPASSPPCGADQSKPKFARFKVITWSLNAFACSYQVLVSQLPCTAFVNISRVCPSLQFPMEQGYLICLSFAT